MSVDTGKLEAMLADLRAASSVAQGGVGVASNANAAGGVDFAEALNSAIEQVSQAQNEAKKITEDFVSGKEGVDLADVMIDMQKASVLFTQMSQVRSKLLEAYREVMNTPV